MKKQMNVEKNVFNMYAECHQSMCPESSWTTGHREQENEEVPLKTEGSVHIELRQEHAN
jgi:hypothetical protein